MPRVPVWLSKLIVPPQQSSTCRKADETYCTEAQRRIIEFERERLRAQPTS
jgi:hypothetical protein